MTQPRQAQLDLLLTISEGLSRGSHEMLRVSPTDAMHAPSCGLAIRDAVEELRWMRAEIERLREAIRTSRARCVELELKNESLSAAADHAGAALAAAIELLERGREDAPSKRMFSQMLADYRVIVARTRRALEG